MTKTGSETPLLDWGPSAAAPIQANPDQSAHGVMGKRNRMKVAKRMERLSRKASSNNCIAARTKTDTGGRQEDCQVSERTVAKELGKIAPYVRKKGRSREPQ